VQDMLIENVRQQIASPHIFYWLAIKMLSCKPAGSGTFSKWNR